MGVILAEYSADSAQKAREDDAHNTYDAISLISPNFVILSFYLIFPKILFSDAV